MIPNQIDCAVGANLCAQLLAAKKEIARLRALLEKRKAAKSP
jgi:hypothetical protein